MQPTDLTTLAAVKAYLNITAAGSDVVLAAMITATSLDWLHWTGRDSLNSTVSYDEWYDGPGGGGLARLMLRNSPILSVSILTSNGVSIPASPDHVAPGYVISQDKKWLGIVGNGRWPFAGWGSAGAYGMFGSSYRVPGSWGFLPGIQNVNVQYSAGYEPVVVVGEAQVVPASPFLLAFTALAQQPWASDQGVSYASGGALELVTGAPTEGQYAIGASGYQFAAADTGKAIVVSYTANQAPLDLQDAVTWDVGEQFKYGQRIGLASETMAAVGSTAYRAWRFPPKVAAVLEYYKRRVA